MLRAKSLQQSFVNLGPIALTELLSPMLLVKSAKGWFLLFAHAQPLSFCKIRCTWLACLRLRHGKPTSSLSWKRNQKKSFRLYTSSSSLNENDRHFKQWSLSATPVLVGWICHQSTVGKWAQTRTSLFNFALIEADNRKEDYKNIIEELFV